MSRSRDIAIELFGIEAGGAMSSAEIYHRLAQDIMHSTIIISAEPMVEASAVNKAAGQTESIDYLAHLAYQAQHHARDALDAGAYSVAYSAQMRDALEENEADRYNSLVELANVYRAVVPLPTSLEA